jgi:hypothetical protein
MFTIKYNKRKDDDLSWEAFNELHFILVGILGFIIAFVQNHSLWIRILLVTSASLFIVIPRVINVQSDKLYITVNSKGINGHLAYFRYREFAWNEIQYIEFTRSVIIGRSFLNIHGSNGESIKSGIWRLERSDKEKLIETINKYTDEHNIPLNVR